MTPKPSPSASPPSLPPSLPPPLPPPGPPTEPPADRFCDLVMNGGITSGVVFPRAIAELARQYRFHSIGGSSAGAMAAAVAAAAEYGRRLGGGSAGFKALERMSQKFGDDVSRQLNRRPKRRTRSRGVPVTRLRALFQPQPTTRRLFNVMLAALEQPGPLSRIVAALGGLLREYAGPALIGASAALLTVWLVHRWVYPQGFIAFVLAAALLAMAGVLVALYRDVVKGLVRNGFGLCNGMHGDCASGRIDALVPWLHKSLQRLAGRRIDGPPLTFGDLHRVRGFPPPWQAPSSVQPDKSIQLQMVTTNLTQGRPVNLPLDDTQPRLFFDPAELCPYFPAPVLAHLKAKSKAYAPKSVAEPALGAANAQLLELPGDELPILVAARLSLSFPLLFSAVPLWAIDDHPDGGAPALRKCWISDGGISANFPIHLFDSAVPRWPTFGIQLTVKNRRSREPRRRVWLPQRHGQGIADHWDRFDEERDRPLSHLWGYLKAIVLVAKDWHDNTLARMPGVRDRVVQVALDEKLEGGLNLAMPKQRIDDLVGWGREAGEALLHRFAPQPGRTIGQASTAGQTRATGQTASGWDEHRWVRLNTYLFGLRRSLDRATASMAGNPHAAAVADQIADAMLHAPLSGQGEWTLSAAQAEALQQLVAALQAAERAFAQAGDVAQPYRPVPEPRLRVRPPG